MPLALSLIHLVSVIGRYIMEFKETTTAEATKMPEMNDMICRIRKKFHVHEHLNIISLKSAKR